MWFLLHADICAFAQCVFVFQLALAVSTARSLERRAFVVEKNETCLAFAACFACSEWPDLCKVFVISVLLFFNANSYFWFSDHLFVVR